MARLRAGIIGLGKVGSRFDEDPKRVGVWTHAGAYAQVQEVELVAGADVDRTALDAFRARWSGAALYSDYRRMLATERLDIVSVCVPTSLHAEAVLAAADAGARAVFCEKPLAATVADGQRIVEHCRARGVVLAVNHTRRWDRNYLWPRDLLQKGFIGRLLGVIAAYSGGVFNIGTHLFDTIQWYAGDARSVTGKWAGSGERADPSVTGLLGLPEGVTATVLALAEPRDELFELDLLGSEGRLRIADNGRRLEAFRYEASPYASGYRVMSPVEVSNSLPTIDRFVAAVTDLVRCLHDGGEPACSGRNGLAALKVAEGLCRSARAGGARQTLEAGC